MKTARLLTILALLSAPLAQADLIKVEWSGIVSLTLGNFGDVRTGTPVSGTHVFDTLTPAIRIDANTSFYETAHQSTITINQRVFSGANGTMRVTAGEYNCEPRLCYYYDALDIT